MGSAVIGVLGVIIGALLTTALAVQLEARARRRAALGASRLLAAELRNVRAMVANTAKHGQWWTSPLPTSAWEAHQINVAAELESSTVDGLSKCYATLGTLNSAAGHDSPREAEPPVDTASVVGAAVKAAVEAAHIRDLTRLSAEGLEPPRDKLVVVPSDEPSPDQEPQLSDRERSALVSLDDVIGESILELDGTARRLFRAKSRVRTLAPVIGSLLLAGLVLLLVVPRPNPTPESVGQAIAEELGEGVVAECDAAGDDWACLVTQMASPSAPGKTCTLTSATSAGAPGVVTAAAQSDARGVVTAAAPASQACAAAFQAEFEATEDGDEIVVVPKPAEEADPGGQPGTSDSPAPEAASEPAWVSEVMALSKREPPIEEAPAKSLWKRIFG